MSDAEADKKRNKLGYQRISIACAHCRRRKIRCLVAEGDPQNRCQNCIRLKKSCAFFPVDQQGVVDTKSQPSSSGAASGPSTGSAPSSSTPPDLDPTRSLEGRHDSIAFPTVPSNVSDDYSGMVGIQINQGTPYAVQNDDSHAARFNSRVFPHDAPYLRQAGPVLQPQTNAHSPWMGAGGFHDPASGAPPPGPDYSHPQYWRQPNLPTSGDYGSSFTYEPMPAPSSSQRPNHYAYPVQRPDQMWPQQPAVRSMSYGQIEGYPHSMDQFSSMPQHLHARPMPQPLEVQSASMMGPGPQSAPLRPDYQGFLDQQQQYAMQHGEYAPKHVLPATHPDYSGPFYDESPLVGSVHGSQHSPLEDSSGYAVHHSQPG